jgi:hypothetical protein
MHEREDRPMDKNRRDKNQFRNTTTSENSDIQQNLSAIP